MFDWFRARREKQDQIDRDTRELFLNALTEIAAHFARGQQASADSVTQLAKATAAQAAAFQAHLNLFQVSGPPTSRALTDQDEFTLELLKHTPPTGGEKSLQWVLDHTGEGL